MTDKRDDGGPAFPGSYTGQHGAPIWSDGMSLRDWFAGLAMQGGLSGLLADGSKIARDDDMRPLAQIAYAMADAMLAERSKP